MITLDEVRRVTNYHAREDWKNEGERDRVISQWEDAVSGLWRFRQGHVISRTPNDVNHGIVITGVNPVISGVTSNGEDAEYTLHMIPPSAFEIIPTSPPWEGVVEITLDIGWDVLPDELGDVRSALLNQIQYNLSRFEGDRIIQRNQGFEGGSTSYQSDPFCIPFKDAANRYMRKVR